MQRPYTGEMFSVGQAFRLVVLLGATTVSLACSEGEDTPMPADSGVAQPAPDAAEADAAVQDPSDGGVAQDATPRSVVRRTATTSNGGGATRSTRFRAVINVGGPQPAGQATGAQGNLTVGPKAARP